VVLLAYGIQLGDIINGGIVNKKAFTWESHIFKLFRAKTANIAISCSIECKWVQGYDNKRRFDKKAKGTLCERNYKV